MKIRYYYEIEPKQPEKREYVDTWYHENKWAESIPERTVGTRGQLAKYWYRDGALTKRRKMQESITGKHDTMCQRFPIGLDIETNSYTERNENGEIVCCEGYAYHMQIIVNNTIIHCSQWWQVMHVFSTIVKKMELGTEYKNRYFCARVWIANAGFEFSFMNQYFHWKEIFATDVRQPIIAETVDGLVFQDALYISGTSLEQTAKMYNLHTQKTHDLDYTKMRISTTPIKEQELYYMSADVRMLAEFNDWLMLNYIDNGLNIPITKTQMLRDSIKKCFNDTEMVNGKMTRFARNLKNLHSAFYDQYSEIIRFLFRGGYCHANYMWAEKTIENVNGVDLTSSYPYAILMQKYPLTPFEKIHVETIDDISKLDSMGYAVIAKIRFYGLENETTHSIESDSKTYEYEEAAQKAKYEHEQGRMCSQDKLYKQIAKPVIDNGRLLAANQCTVYLTELDLRTYRFFYSWKSYEILECSRAVKGYLPDYVRYPVMVYYERKCKLKKAGLQGTVEYKLAKEMANSAYGMMCEKLHLSDIVFDDNDNEWYVQPPDKNDVDNEYNGEIFGEKCLQGIIPPRKKLPTIWGVYTTANARYNLLSMVFKIGDDCIYCDTDSIYIHDIDKYRNLIDDYNRVVMEKNLETINAWNKTHEPDKRVNAELFVDLGTFDYLSPDNYIKFKTLGAKRYIKTDKYGKTEQVVAGLPKHVLQEYCESFAWGADPYALFDNNMMLPNVKRAHKYNDKPHGRIIYDYLGDCEYMFEMSSCGIFDIDFSLKMSSDYMQLLELRYEKLKRYWYKGEYAT